MNSSDVLVYRANASWWSRVTRRLAGTVGAFGFAGALLLAECEPTASAPPPGPALEAKPVEAPCTYRDTFGDPRSGGRVHLGVDIMAAQGNDLYAAVDGTITKVYVASQDLLAGNGVRITQPDGTYFFYAHMLRVAPNITVGTRVTAGQLVGYVGMTGNAGTPHLHFEIHPQGGAAINPYPIVKYYGAC
jgi:peptidoglycan LD-endopeptidase LytH